MTFQPKSNKIVGLYFKPGSLLRAKGREVGHVLILDNACDNRSAALKVKRSDLDGDGVISKSEFTVAMEETLANWGSQYVGESFVAQWLEDLFVKAGVWRFGDPTRWAPVLAGIRDRSGRRSGRRRVVSSKSSCYARLGHTRHGHARKPRDSVHATVSADRGGSSVTCRHHDHQTEPCPC